MSYKNFAFVLLGFVLGAYGWYALGPVKTQIERVVERIEIPVIETKTVIKEVKVPTLIIGGAKDSVTPLSFQREFHQKIKGSKLQIIPYGSHCSQLDMPDLVNLRIEKFLSEIAYR